MAAWLSAETRPRPSAPSNNGSIPESLPARCRATARTDPDLKALDKALDEAGARGWTVVSMKEDWKAVFAQ